MCSASNHGRPRPPRPSVPTPIHGDGRAARPTHDGYNSRSVQRLVAGLSAQDGAVDVRVVCTDSALRGDRFAGEFKSLRCTEFVCTSPYVQESRARDGIRSTASYLWRVLSSNSTAVTRTTRGFRTTLVSTTPTVSGSGTPCGRQSRGLQANIDRCRECARVVPSGPGLEPQGPSRQWPRDIARRRYQRRLPKLGRPPLTM
jgi:hypothetical protein